MGIFGEKYSRESYEEAEKESESALKIAKFRGGIDMEKANYTDAQMQRVYDDLWGKSNKAQKRVEKLSEKGQIEATKLNEKYNFLQTKAKEALQAIADFERDELGMKEENQDSSS